MSEESLVERISELLNNPRYALPRLKRAFVHG